MTLILQQILQILQMNNAIDLNINRQLSCLIIHRQIRISVQIFIICGQNINFSPAAPLPFCGQDLEPLTFNHKKVPQLHSWRTYCYTSINELNFLRSPLEIITSPKRALPIISFAMHLVIWPLPYALLNIYIQHLTHTDHLHGWGFFSFIFIFCIWSIV